MTAATADASLVSNAIHVVLFEREESVRAHGIQMGWMIRTSLLVNGTVEIKTDQLHILFSISCEVWQFSISHIIIMLFAM